MHTHHFHNKHTSKSKRRTRAGWHKLLLCWQLVSVFSPSQLFLKNVLRKLPENWSFELFISVLRKIFYLFHLFLHELYFHLRGVMFLKKHIFSPSQLFHKNVVRKLPENCSFKFFISVLRKSLFFILFCMSCTSTSVVLCFWKSTFFRRANFFIRM